MPFSFFSFPRPRTPTTALGALDDALAPPPYVAAQNAGQCSPQCCTLRFVFLVEPSVALSPAMGHRPPMSLSDPFSLWLSPSPPVSSSIDPSLSAFSFGFFAFSLCLLSPSPLLVLVSYLSLSLAHFLSLALARPSQWHPLFCPPTP